MTTTTVLPADQLPPPVIVDTLRGCTWSEFAQSLVAQWDARGRWSDKQWAAARAMAHKVLTKAAKPQRPRIENGATRRVPFGNGRQRTEVRCCNTWLLCQGFTNTCDRCGTDYNMSGQRLAPRSQWGEETGEHWTDCI